MLSAGAGRNAWEQTLACRCLSQYGTGETAGKAIGVENGRNRQPDASNSAEAGKSKKARQSTRVYNFWSSDTITDLGLVETLFGSTVQHATRHALCSVLAQVPAP